MAVDVKIRKAPPRTNAMLEALRGLGYTPAAALADIVDNGIAAGATDIGIFFHWQEKNSAISVVDNGRGMSDGELENAMTLGAINPQDERASSDLGRFGMGLKTASFSQCRRLTVASKTIEGVQSCLRWDLDKLQQNPGLGWALFEGPDPESMRLLEPLRENTSGTIVLWECLDRIVTDGYTQEYFLNLIDQIEQWLGMIFHRFLEGSSADLRLTINGRNVKYWDPFMMGHRSKVWNSPIARLNSSAGPLDVECHVLPHKDRLSQSEWEKAQGPEGWTSQQGFYIYRNRRLLVAGSWLGLGGGRKWVRDEAHRLARIRVDIPNTADADWRIDIRKSTARPPVYARDWLTRLADQTREKARRVFAYRGKYVTKDKSASIACAWKSKHLKDGVCYRIDENHPAISAVLDAAGENFDLIKTMLRVIEVSVPVQKIWLDTAENRDTPKMGLQGEAPEEIRNMAKVIFTQLTVQRGLSKEIAISQLQHMEPFSDFPELMVDFSN